MIREERWDALARCLAPLVDPLVDELPAPAGQSLRRCAVAPRLDADLCRLLGGDGAVILCDPGAGGLFLEAGGDGSYRLHPAARAAMAQRLGANETAQLRRIAGRHYASRGMTCEAIEQMLACGDLVEAAALVDKVAMSMIERGDIGRVRDWIDRLPSGMVAGSQGLARAANWLAVLQAGEPPEHDILDAAEARVLDLLHRAYGGDRPTRRSRLATGFSPTPPACPTLL